MIIMQDTFEHVFYTTPAFCLSALMRQKKHVPNSKKNHLLEYEMPSP